MKFIQYRTDIVSKKMEQYLFVPRSAFNVQHSNIWNYFFFLHSHCIQYDEIASHIADYGLTEQFLIYLLCETLWIIFFKWNEGKRWSALYALALYDTFCIYARISWISPYAKLCIYLFHIWINYDTCMWIIWIWHLDKITWMRWPWLCSILNSPIYQKKKMKFNSFTKFYHKLFLIPLIILILNAKWNRFGNE